MLSPSSAAVPTKEDLTRCHHQVLLYLPQRGFDMLSPSSEAVPTKEDLTRYHHQVLLYLLKRILHTITIKCCSTCQRGFDML
jgi:hypothetical protein